MSLMKARMQEITIAAALMLGASAGNAAGPDKTAIPDVRPGQAQIVVMRSTTVNALVSTLLYDVTSGQPKVIGKISNNRKVVWDVAPGDYVLMVGPVNMFEFMQVSVSADKRYFAVLAPVWPANYFLRPVRHQDSQFLYSSKDFDRLLKKTKLAEPYAQTMDEDEIRKLGDSYRMRWEKWQTKSSEEKSSLAIRPEDSVN